MGKLIAVMADSKDEAAALLKDVCEALGFTPMASGRVFETPGQAGRWMARAIPADAQQRQPGRACTDTPDAVK
jgi:hypothetical protein